MRATVLALGVVALVGVLRIAGEIAAPRRRCRTCGQLVDDVLDPDGECGWHWNGTTAVMAGS